MHLSTKFLLVAASIPFEIVHAANIPYKFVKEGKEDAIDNFVEIQFDKYKGTSYRQAVENRKNGLTKRGNNYADITLMNQKNFYSVNLSIGTPSQNVTVLVDTGSSDLWVVGNNNPYCLSNHPSLANDFDEASNNDVWDQILLKDTYIRRNKNDMIKRKSDDDNSHTTSTSIDATATLSDGIYPTDLVNCSQYGTFNKNKSRTFRSNKTVFAIQYQDNSSASGYWGHDTVRFGNVSLKDMSFGVANRSNASVGILGIALPALEATYKGVINKTSYMYDNFPMVLKNQGYIKKAAYSLFLNKSNSTQGSLLMGAVDLSKFEGNLYTLPILSPVNSSLYPPQSLLMVALQSINIIDGGKNQTINNSRMPVILDSGTTLCSLPLGTIKQLVSSLEVIKFRDDLNMYQVKCQGSSRKNQSTEVVSFNFGGFDIKVPINDFIIKGDSDSCLFGIFPTAEGNVIGSILGDLFLTHAYVVYDLEDSQIAMAQASYSGGKPRYRIIDSSIPSAIEASGYNDTIFNFSNSSNATVGVTANVTTSVKRNRTNSIVGSAIVNNTKIKSNTNTSENAATLVSSSSIWAIFITLIISTFT